MTLINITIEIYQRTSIKMARLNSSQGLFCLLLCVLSGGCGADSNAANPVAPSQTSADLNVQASSELTVESLADGSYRCHPGGTGPFAGILYNHGGLGTDVGGDLEGVCRSFAEIGYVAWSQQRPNSISLNGQFESVLEGFEALRAETDVDPNRLGILGFSRGGLLMLQAAISRGGAVRSIVLCAPAPGNGTLERTLVDVARIQASVRIYVAENDQQIKGGTVNLSRFRGRRRPWGTAEGEPS